VGIAVQAERARRRGGNVEAFLVRRFLILFAVGAFHMVLICNVDILCMYAVCGLAIILFLRLPAAGLAAAGLAALYLPSILRGWPHLPGEAAMRAHATLATQVYAHGSFFELVQFRWQETVQYTLPLVVLVAQTSLGLMLVGAALWRSGIIRQPERYRRILWTFCAVAGTLGLINTTAALRGARVPWTVAAFGSNVPLALAYAAALLAWRRSKRIAPLAAPFIAMGRMALTNYLMQSIVFAIVFYGFGFGLFGRLDPRTALALGIVFYAAQLRFSIWWLARYRFGPFEWLWRSLTYGRRQPMRVE
jgi:uncharacterized protein